MILVDTTIWIDHIRAADPALSQFLNDGQVLMHSAVLVEVALGYLKRRELTLSLLRRLPVATVATDTEVMRLINARSLEGRGVGYVDVHLLASARLDGSNLWTRDKRLQDAAQELGVAANF